MGTSLDGKNITPATLVADITSDYEWIYANYEGFEGDKDLNYIHASNQYQDFAAKLRFMYGNQMCIRDSLAVGLLTRNVTRALSVLMVDYSCAIKLSTRCV